jgi:hypothetical protein
MTSISLINVGASWIKYAKSTIEGYYLSEMVY